MSLRLSAYGRTHNAGAIFPVVVRDARDRRSETKPLDPKSRRRERRRTYGYMPRRSRDVSRDPTETRQVLRLAPWRQTSSCSAVCAVAMRRRS